MEKDVHELVGNAQTKKYKTSPALNILKVYLFTHFSKWFSVFGYCNDQNTWDVPRLSKS